MYKSPSLSLLTFFSFIFFPAAIAEATVNIESLRKGINSEGIFNSISLYADYKDGNTNINKYKASLRTDYIKGDYITFLSASLQQGENDNVSYINKGFVHLRGMKKMTDIFTAETFVQKQYNDFTLLKDRNLIGAGLRIKLLKAQKESKTSFYSLHLGIGLMEEEETIALKPEEKRNITRSTNYLSGHLNIDSSLNINGTLYYQADISNTSDNSILFDGDMAIHITETISFTININYRYDSHPPATVEAQDLEITNGISIAF